MKIRRASHVDPVTGDELTGGEYLSWLVQGIIRRWTFLLVITLITIAVWSTNNSMALIWWNLGASYLALVIESVVGIAMFSQTRRDAVVLRETRKLSQGIEKVEQQEIEILQHIEKQMSRLEALEEITGRLAWQVEENHEE